MFLVIVLCFGCTPPEVSEVVGSKSFYDLKAFLDSEKERILQSGIQLEKTVILNGKKETQILKEFDLDIEFSELYASDINRTSWLDKYEEEKKEEQAYTRTYYKVRDQSLEVKSLKVLEGDSVPTLIQIIKSTDNLLNQSDKKLTYDSSDGYSIKSVRKSVGRPADTLEILVEFK